ncbi:MAG: SDR family oxidoreductase [Planctomycetota bacterium]
MTPKGNRPICAITGGAKRVGRAVAAALAAKGWDLALTYRTSDDEAQQLASDLARDHGIDTRLDHLDLDDLEAAETYARTLAADLPRLDALVHNASIYAPCPLNETTADEAMRYQRVNALAPLLITKYLAPRLASSDQPAGGAIVAFSDMHVLGRPRDGFAAYAMSKAAITEMVRSLAIELAPRVRVNAVAPGVVAFPESGYESDDEAQRAYLERVPLDRPGTPQDAAEATRWLIEDARYCTGQIIRLDGGRWLA